MNYRVIKTFHPNKGVSCCFRNWRAKTHCNVVHGHDLIFEVTFESEKLDERGWIIDFGCLGSLKDLIEETFDHKTIVAQDDPDINWYREGQARGIMALTELPQVSTEQFACWLAVRAHGVLCEMNLTDRVWVYSTRVYETGANKAEYFVV